MSSVLVIDDELDANHPLGRKLVEVLGRYHLEPVFARTWRDPDLGARGEELVTSGDVRLVFLDVMFPGQSMEGGDIFAELHEMRPDLPVIILTQRDVFTEAQEFFERGASHYIVKQQVMDDPEAVATKIRQCLDDPAGADLTAVLWILEPDRRVLVLDMEDPAGRSILSRPKRVGHPLATLILACAEAETRQAYFTELNTDGTVVGLEPWTRTDIQKNAWKFNRRICEATDGRIQTLLRGLGVYGASAFELAVGRVLLRNGPFEDANIGRRGPDFRG